MKTLAIAAQPSTGQDGAEHASERTSVRERARAEVNAGMSRIGGDR
jgi:hypothetical protein